MILRPRQALFLATSLFLLFWLIGGYPAILAASSLSIFPIVYASRAQTRTTAVILPLYLSVVGGTAAQAIFGAGPFVLRLLLGIAAGAFIGLTCSLIAMIVSHRRRMRGAAA